MKYYKLNGNITVLPGRNMVNDVKLEPRLMKLLCLLLEKQGNTVTREEIIRDIWNGYGGGDEGLTQAISFLRKVLNDTDKMLIETVPKVGYVFNGEVIIEEPQTGEAEITGTSVNSSSGKAKKFIIVIGLLLVLALAVFIILSKENNIAPKAPASDITDQHRPAPVAK